jgi:hypothetical protein
LTSGGWPIKCHQGSETNKPSELKNFLHLIGLEMIPVALSLGQTIPVTPPTVNQVKYTIGPVSMGNDGPLRLVDQGIAFFKHCRVIFRIEIPQCASS